MQGFIKPFRSSFGNKNTFNKTYRILAERLQINLEIDDASLVPTKPGTFGDLTYKTPSV